MAVTNADISIAFNELADLLDLEGENVFRVRAYRNAARVIADLSHDINDYIAQGHDLKDLPYIGIDLEQKIKEMVRTGQVSALEKIKKKVPPGVTDLLTIPGLGPRRVSHLSKDLNIHSLDELARACHDHKVRELDGFGEKTEARILEELEGSHPKEHRIRLSIAEQYASHYMDYLKQSPVVKDAVVCGSLRRRKESVGDLDMLILATNAQSAIEHATKYEDIIKSLARGTTRATVILKSKLQVDIRVLENKDSWGAAQLYLTGSKDHNIVVRQIAHEHGLKLNEYGLFEKENQLPCATEKEIYHALSMEFIPPELRENSGEIDAALKHSLPDLIELSDLKGDLHSHTKSTDGRNTLKEMANAARHAGLKYLAISDHSPHLRIVHGMGERRLLEQIREIDQLNQEMDGITLLKAMEVDIEADGTLDMPDHVLEQLDLTICSIHSSFNLSREEQTKRILKAMDNPNFTIFGHPSGRLLGERRPIDFDIERVIEHAAKRQCFLELNAHPERLDLTDKHCRMAREAGVLVAINSDAHSTFDFCNLRFGIGQARRGWLEKKDVLNCLSLKSLLRLLSSKKRR